MHILITGAAGFLGQYLAKALLQDEAVTALTLADVSSIPILDDPRVQQLELDITNANTVMNTLPKGIDATYHLAAVVSAGAEADFELGMRVNLDGTRHVLEALRHTSPGSRIIFASSLAIYGGNLPDVITDMTAFTPQGSYGTQKAISELLVNDYSRKGYLDGLSLRLPTVSVRPGKPNKAASSFASSIIREPLFGQEAVCPVDPSLEVWLTSPEAVVASLQYALSVDTSGLSYRGINIPGITVTVQEMIDALEAVAGPEARQHIRFERTPELETLINSWPTRFETTLANQLRFPASNPFEETVRTFIQNYVS
ncbi:MAG: D-erythronate dehydrogenase [Deinococcota bacterium]